MSGRVSVVDYGVGNLYSVTRALQQVGATVELVSAPDAIERADKLVVPGVGAFRSCMESLARFNLIDAIKAHAGRGKPMLGICVGMQMLFDSSDEFGFTPGLSLLRGRVIAIPHLGANGHPHKIPHIGWNQLRSSGSTWQGTCLQGLTPGDASVYFVHSFTAQPQDQAVRLADADYDGCVISAVVRSGSIYGCQFHPEKSGEVGLKILANFAFF